MKSTLHELRLRHHRQKRLAGILLLAAAAPALAQRADIPQVERLVVEQTNRFRHEQGLAPVKPDRGLAKAAHEFADYMARTERYGHEADGRKPQDRARAAGYDYCLVAENIAYVYNSRGFRLPELVSEFVEGWKNSPEHRHNMLEPSADDTAVAVARSERSGRYYAVQMFGRPKSAQVEFRVRNASPRAVSYRLGDRSYSLRPRETRIHWSCVPEELSLHSGGAAQPREDALRPKRGERYAIVGEGGSVFLRRE